MAIFDSLIVGAGITGAVIAEQLANRLGQRVMLIDRRTHLGGLCHDYHNEAGVLVHPHGLHLLHTPHQRVWDYLQAFGEWHPYKASTLAVVNGKRIPVPFNLNSLHILLPEAEAERLERKLIARFGADRRFEILLLSRSGDPELESLADFIRDKIFHAHPSGRAGVFSHDLSPELGYQVPISTSRDNHRYNAPYQGLPAKKGYAGLFKHLLKHRHIHYLLQTEASDILALDETCGVIRLMDEPFAGNLFYTGRLDELFGLCHGELGFRTLMFEFETYDRPYFQEPDTMLYYGDKYFTKITEFKRATGQELAITTILREYPQAYDRQNPHANEPYYPVASAESPQRLERYRQLARGFPQLYPLGHLADHSFYSMGESIHRALQLVDRMVLSEVPPVKSAKIGLDLRGK
ncbi:MAG: FAD-dependent oxidoreductase [Pseudomonadota bacterium]